MNELPLDSGPQAVGEVMTISEEARHAMYLKFEEVLGAQVANTVMEHLPPVGWADVATKRDLDAQIGLVRSDLDAQVGLVRSDLDAQIGLVRSDLDAGLARVDAGLARVSAELSERLRTQTLVMCSTVIAAMGVVAALARA